MEWLGLLIPVGLIVLLIVLVVLVVHARRRERARQALLQQWVGDNGWSYVPSPSVDWMHRLPGRRRKGVSLLLSGTVSGRPVNVAEYSYTESRTTTDSEGRSHTTSETHRYIVVVVNLRRPLPDLEVRPRAGLSRLARTWFGGGTQSTEIFDQRFRVLGDAETAGQVIPPALYAEHVAGTVPPWSVHHTELMTYSRGRLQDPERIPELAGPLLRVAEHLDPQQ
jgi:hypothetical protein